MSLNLNNDILEAIFETFSNEVQVLETVKNTENKIIDFKYISGSKGTFENSENLGHKPGSSMYSWKKEAGLFDQLIKVVETDEPLDRIFYLDENGNNKWYHIRAKKFNNGLIVYREDITMAKQAEEK